MLWFWLSEGNRNRTSTLPLPVPSSVVCCLLRLAIAIAIAVAVEEARAGKLGRRPGRLSGGAEACERFGTGGFGRPHWGVVTS